MFLNCLAQATLEKFKKDAADFKKLYDKIPEDQLSIFDTLFSRSIELNQQMHKQECQDLSASIKKRLLIKLGVAGTTHEGVRYLILV